MAEKKSSISAKTTIKVNLVLIVFLVFGGLGITYYQNQHLEQLITMEETALEEELFRRGVLLSQVGSKAVSKIIEEAIDNTAFTVADFFDTEYKEIPGFDPPKYHTKVDSYLDKAILSLQDEFLQDSDIVYAVTVDVNGYVPTHNTVYQQPITGDKEKDKVGNRTKQLFNDSIGIKASQNKQLGFRQIYRRNTGETLWDISSPIMVKGKHWGGFRVGVALATIDQANTKFKEKTDVIRAELRNTQLAMMVGVLLVSLFAVFLTISLALKPLKLLTVAANDLADGKIETPIEARGDDELGQLADVLERLRLSLQKSMDRLRKQR